MWGNLKTILITFNSYKVLWLLFCKIQSWSSNTKFPVLATNSNPYSKFKPHTQTPPSPPHTPGTATNLKSQEGKCGQLLSFLLSPPPLFLSAVPDSFLSQLWRDNSWLTPPWFCIVCGPCVHDENHHRPFALTQCRSAGHSKLPSACPPTKSHLIPYSRFLRQESDTNPLYEHSNLSKWAHLIFLADLSWKAGTLGLEVEVGDSQTLMPLSKVLSLDLLPPDSCVF